jgi:hypothetical protein
MTETKTITPCSIDRSVLHLKYDPGQVATPMVAVIAFRGSVLPERFASPPTD